MALRTEAIKAFLDFRAPRDLAELYNEAMEVQVKVLPGKGELIEDETPEGRRFRAFRDPISGEQWKDFRIPWMDGNYHDSDLHFALDLHAEAIGMTGWNWQACQSEWVGFDFDSVIGHKKGLTDEQLKGIVAAVSSVPWVTVRRSRGGKGIHLYVPLDPPVETADRAEHAALARSVLMHLSAISGVDLKASVDVLGCVLWAWHHQVKAGGLTLIKQGTALTDVPPNWRDHLVVSRRTSQRCGTGVEGLDDLVGLTRQVPLDAQHKKLLAWFGGAKSRGALWWWDGDRHMLVCHTQDLLVAHKELQLPGVFYTNAASAAFSGHQNCFAFPVRNGGWAVRRHGHNVAEHPSWTRDANGWTKCVYGRPAELRSVAAAHKGLENSSGEYVFAKGKDAIQAMRDLGVSSVPDVPEMMTWRPARLEQHDAGRLLLSLQREASDMPMDGWLPSKRGTHWELLASVVQEQADGEPPDDMVRHVVSGGQDAGWFLHARGGWIMEPRQNVSAYMIANGVKRPDVEPTLGRAIGGFWELVNRPFAEEYPGNRQWNKFGAKLAVTPVEGVHPTWTAVLRHVGHSLNKELKDLPWAVQAGIKDGYDYLRCWCAALVQQPLEPLPYLFLYGPQKSGKSIFHEALALLIGRGYVRADTALTSSGRFNAELAGSVLCIIEETNLHTNRGAYDRIKDWVTGRVISIHEKGCTPYDLANSCHWVQCANEAGHLPLLPGDTRITMLFVDALGEGAEVPKQELLGLLAAEAPAFLFTLLKQELPPVVDRLRLPVVDTADKLQQMQASRSELQVFLEECLVHLPGAILSFDEFYSRFEEWLSPTRRLYWNPRKVGREFSHPLYVKGRYGKGGQIHVGNCTWPELLTKDTKPGAKWIQHAEKLVQVG